MREEYAGSTAMVGAERGGRIRLYRNEAYCYCLSGIGRQKARLGFGDYGPAFTPFCG
jgi:hypothetical protein